MSATTDRAEHLGLPVDAVVTAFDRGVPPAAIAHGFGIDDEVPLIVEVITDALSHRGLTADEIAARFGEVWGWDRRFTCAGYGEVVTETVPYCPTCEAKPSEFGKPWYV